MSIDDIDPARHDVIDQRKRRRKRKAAPMPENLKPWAEKARRQLEKMPASPGVMVEVRDGANVFTSPHDDLAAWEVQLGSAFGTRSISTIRTFTRQLADLCEQTFDNEAGAWKPNERELNAALNIVNGIRPKNEVEAALAAQMVAVHFLTMKVAEAALRSPWDARTASSAGKLARTFAMQSDALLRLKGKRRFSSQKIKVSHEKHVHHHQHVHLAGGVFGNGGQPHAAMGDGSVENVRGAALPSEDPGGVILPLRVGAGETCLPDARRLKPRRSER